VLALSIDPKYRPVYRDARVQIRPNTPLQDMYVDIVGRGTRTAGTLPSGGELAASQTQTPVQFGEVIDIFDASVRPRVTATIDALGQGLGDHGVQLREALVELAPFLQAAQRLAYETASRQLQTRRLVHNFALLSGELAGRSTQLSELVRDGATTMTRLASVEQPLGQLIDELPPTLRVLPPAFAAVNTAAAQLDPAARSLLPVADALAPALSALQRLSPTATTALGALDRTLPGLTHLLSGARPLATWLGRSFTLLRPQAPELDRATAAIHPCETAVEKFFQWTLSVSKLSGLHGDMQRGVGLLGPQSAAGLVSPTVNGNHGLLSVAPTCSGVPAGP
jgi:ABC-type transporter Mla subunit MlaD